MSGVALELGRVEGGLGAKIGERMSLFDRATTNDSGVATMRSLPVGRATLVVHPTTSPKFLETFDVFNLF